MRRNGDGARRRASLALSPGRTSSTAASGAWPTGTICVYTLTDVHVIVDVVGHT